MRTRYLSAQCAFRAVRLRQRVPDVLDSSAVLKGRPFDNFDHSWTRAGVNKKARFWQALLSLECGRWAGTHGALDTRQRCERAADPHTK